MLQRRDVLSGAGALGASLTVPSLVQARNQRVLRFVPQADLAILDPIWTPAYVTRNHGYLVFDTLFGTPSSHILLRGNGAFFGWPKSERLDQLRAEWFAAPDLAAQKAAAAAIQRQALGVDVPYLPLGQYFQPTAYRSSLTGVLPGFATFWNVRRA